MVLPPRLTKGKLLVNLNLTFFSNKIGLTRMLSHTSHIHSTDTLPIASHDNLKPLCLAGPDEKLRRENIKGKKEAGNAHFEVGARVRQTIKELGGTMPEDLPTPNKSVKQIEKEEAKRLEK